MRTKKKAFLAICDMWQAVLNPMIQVSRNHRPSLWHRNVGDPVYKLLRCMEAGLPLVQDTSKMNGSIMLGEHAIPADVVTKALGLCLLDFKAGHDQMSYDLHSNAWRLLLEIDIKNRKSHPRAIPKTARSADHPRFQARTKS